MRRLVAALRPDAIAAVKWDLWPNLVLEAERRGCPTLLLGGVLGPDSGRARWPGRLLAVPLHQRLAGVGAASERDALAFAALGVPAGRVAVTGDTRFDRVLARVAEARPSPLQMTDGGPCLVAGSSWPAEEDLLLDALATLLGKRSDLRLLLVPHEPSADAIARLRRGAAERGLTLWTLSERPALADGGVCVADRVGILPELYAAGEIALVGGGFGRGVHSVLEPAARGLPVLMGPRAGRADEARRLVEAGGAFVVEDGPSLLARWRALLDPDARALAGRAAGDFVRAGAGAVERSLDFLDAARGALPPEPA
jgi:3-deoxy-D-manno-octulosonic-acid transferase